MKILEVKTLTNDNNITRFRVQLIKWYQKNKRALPFRDSQDPYKIWLSEIMAQQTTMNVVVGYYERFIKKYPTVQAVAGAQEKDLLKLWQGLGYYARIRNFQKACQFIVAEHQGKVSRTFQELKKLKGVGDYTAAAIASICFNEDVAVVDGNVKRVVARLFNYKNEINSPQAKKYFETKANLLVDTRHPGQFNEAMMELGALVCQRKPGCQRCPVATFCAAKDKSPEKLPVKNKMTYKNITYVSLIVHDHNKFIVKEPTKDSLVRHLWELPTTIKTENMFSNLVGQRKTVKIGQVKHAITNKRITTIVQCCLVSPAQLTKLSGNGFKALSRKELNKIPVNAMTQKCLDLFLR
jgi:A/G-specific adenine glycosylase